MNDKRIFNEKELVEVLSKAEALQKLDESREEANFIESVGKTLQTYSDIDEEIVYSVADELKIPKEYVRQALETNYIPKEEQIDDIKNHNAAPTFQLIQKTYHRDLFNALQRFSPLEKFYCYDKWFRCRFSKAKTRERFLRKTINLEVLATAFSWRYISEGTTKVFYDFELFDPLFLHACGNTLKMLEEEKFKGFVENRLKYHYLI